MQRLTVRSNTRLNTVMFHGSARPLMRGVVRSISTVNTDFSAERQKNLRCIALKLSSSRTFMTSSGVLIKKIDPKSAASTRYFSSYPPHTIIPLPSLSPTMETGIITNWLLKEGEFFKAGEAIFEIETDKALVTFDATDEGWIAKILVTDREPQKVGTPTMITVDNEEDMAAFKNYVYSDSSTPAPVVEAAPAVATPAPVVHAAPAAVVQAAATPSSPSPASPSPSSTPSGQRVVTSPLARKLLRESSLSPSALENIKGSGPGGRVVSADVLAAIAVGKSAAPIVQAAIPTHTSAPAVATQTTSKPVAHISGVYSDFELSDLARAVAARQTATMLQVPHYYLSVELNLNKLLILREQLNASRAKGTELSVLDFIVKASALAVQQVPDVNATWMDTFVRRFDQVDVNLVMGSGSGLVTPVLKDVQRRGLSSISNEIASFEDSLFSESGAPIANEKMSIGTFSIHNLGMYGVKSASPIVLAPQACALALGAIIDTVVPREGGADKVTGDDWAVAPVMVATLSCDHRVVDGAVGAQWLSALKTLVENPSSMLL